MVLKFYKKAMPLHLHEHPEVSLQLRFAGTFCACSLAAAVRLKSCALSLERGPGYTSLKWYAKNPEK